MAEDIPQCYKVSLQHACRLSETFAIQCSPQPGRVVRSKRYDLKQDMVWTWNYTEAVAMLQDLPCSQYYGFDIG